MKKIALLLVIVFTLSMSLAFADIIIPSGETEQTSEDVQTTSEVVSSEETEVEVADDSGSTETTKTALIEENEEVVKAENTSNPIGGILAIVVVIILVAVVALVSKK
jgi:cobalamin biosynthesis Mg chelatase CobN